MATPFDKLASNDLTLIENYIRDYIADEEYDDLHGKFAGVENILAPWNRAKTTLFKLFGEELILSKEFSFCLAHPKVLKQITINIINKNIFLELFLFIHIPPFIMVSIYIHNSYS